MDSNEATRIVFSRIHKIDPDNASKIMGFLLIQDHGEKEMIRLSFGPEALIHTVILRARKELGISPSTPLPHSPNTPPHSPNTPLSRQNSSSSSSRFGFNNNANAAAASSLATPAYPFSGGASTSSWNSSVLMDFHNPEHILSPSGCKGGGNFNSSLSSLCGNRGGEVIDDFQLNDHLSFLNDTSPSFGLSNSEELSTQQELFASNLANDQTLPHKRSFSVSDMGLGSDYDPISGDELGWKPCLYFSKGLCKDGTSCRYHHGGGYDPSMISSSDGSEHLVGSPNAFEMMEHSQDLLRSRSLQHQHRLATASQLMASSSFPFSGSKSMNLLLQQQQNESPRSRLEKNHFLMNGGLDMVNPNSRQIYLTFPADSTFREEDVSNYFSIYGPVQDVRIPYQQKRMFGFVTFVYPETVKIILAKGNPHFVCDSRVLVKPYKEKGKILDKFRKQPQQLERGEYSLCGSPTGLDARDPFDIHLGPRMFYNGQDFLWRRKQIEEQDLQLALEVQSRRLMSLQLLDVKKQHYNHHRAFSTGGISGSSPTHSPSFFNQNVVSSLDRRSPESLEEKCCSPPKAISTDAGTDQRVLNGAMVEKENSGSVSVTESAPIPNKDANLPECSLHNLPGSPFASPTKEVDGLVASSNEANEVEKNGECSGVSAPTSTNNIAIDRSLVPTTSTIGISSFSSCYFQIPGISSSNGAIGM